MHKIFESFINSFVATEIGRSHELLSPSLSIALKKQLLLLYDTNQMNAARIGNHDTYDPAQKIRSDKIYWLDRIHGIACENAFLDVMDALVKYLNETCYTGITAYEFHYAYYEVGMFYSKHLDQFKSNSDRRFSIIFYLNDHWIPADGGALRAYVRDETIDILPEMGSSVLFKSDRIIHEVLPTNRPRLSITGWLKVGQP